MSRDGCVSVPLPVYCCWRARLVALSDLVSVGVVERDERQVTITVTSIAVTVAAIATAVMSAVWKVMAVPMRGDTMNVPTGLSVSWLVTP